MQLFQPLRQPFSAPKRPFPPCGKGRSAFQYGPFCNAIWPISQLDMGHIGKPEAFFCPKGRQKPPWNFYFGRKRSVKFKETGGWRQKTDNSLRGCLSELYDSSFSPVARSACGGSLHHHLAASVYVDAPLWLLHAHAPEGVPAAADAAISAATMQSFFMMCFVL